MENLITPIIYFWLIVFSLVFLVVFLLLFFLFFLFNWRRIFFNSHFYFSDQIEKLKKNQDFYFFEMADAISFFSQKKIGCIVILERKQQIKPLLHQQGYQLNANFSAILLKNIFAFKESQMHDGAVLISSNWRIVCASAILKLPKNKKFSKKYGTRHNAASTMAQETDAIVIVVSETGKISYFIKNKQISINEPEQIIEHLKKNFF